MTKQRRHRLTRRRLDAIISALVYYATEFEDGNMPPDEDSRFIDGALSWAFQERSRRVTKVTSE